VSSANAHVKAQKIENFSVFTDNTTSACLAYDQTTIPCNPTPWNEAEITQYNSVIKERLDKRPMNTRLFALVSAALFCAISSAFPALAETPGAPGNLVANGNFETDADANGSPDGWSAVEPGKTWETENGNRFYRLKALEPDKSTSTHELITIPDGIRAFELSWKQRVTGLKLGKERWYDARVIVNVKDAAAQPLKGPDPFYTQTDTQGWETKSIKFTVPKGVKTLQLMPMLFNVETGTFDIDDIVLKGTPLAFPVITGIPGAPGSVITNGHFENDADADGSPDDWEGVKPGKSWETEGGNRFYRLTALEPDKYSSLYRRVSLPDGVGAFELSWKQRVTGLKIGKERWYDARVVVNFKDAEGRQIKGPDAAYTQKDTPGWETKTIQFLVPTGAKDVEVMPLLFNVEAGRLDIDDVTLTPIDATPLKVAAAAKAEKEAREIAQRQENALKNIGPDGNIVSNGDFQTLDNSGAKPQNWAPANPPISWGMENDNRFLHLTVGQPRQMVGYHRSIDLPAGSKALELKWRQRVTGLKIGEKQYYDARIVVNFKNAAGQIMNNPPPPAYSQEDTKGWVERSTTFLIPEGAVSLELQPMLFQAEAGTFDIDNISLKSIDAAPLLIAKAKKEAEDKFNNVAPEVANKAKWPSELRVVGTKVLNKEGREVLLRGVNVPSLGWSSTGENVLRSFMVAIDDWKSNVVRLPVRAEFWFAKDESQKDGGVAYRKLIDDAITMAANRGAYTVLDLHSFRAPKQIHAEFWKEAAAKYKDNPAVLFDVYNEPYNINWEVWLKGGLVEDKDAVYSGSDEVAFLNEEEKQVKGFRSVGMQALVDAIRGAGAKNIIIVGGLDYSYDLSGMAKGFIVDEKGGNGMMLSTHIYAQKRDYPGKVLIMADKYPIFVGEFGANTKKFDFMPAEAQEDAETWVPKIFGFMQKHKMHYTGWSFHPGAGPMMLKGWNYEPTPEWGAVAKRALAGEKFPYKGMR
jgi:endoglucanase